MPRLPKNFQINWVSIENLEPEGYVVAGPDTAVPSRFEAHFQLGSPEAAVTMEVFVGADLRPVVIELRIRSKVRTPITTSVLRQVLVDQLLQAALDKAAVPSTVRDNWLASLPPSAQPPIQRSDMHPADRTARGYADADASTAAQIYAEAVASGSRAPAVAVANTMNRSRAQVARYIRRARELGLLPPRGLSEKT